MTRVPSEAFVKDEWGSPDTEPWHANPERREIGEIWFTASPAVPILVKLLFTRAKLSIQVHPDDDYAGEHEKGSPGKTEMWHVLRAAPHSRVALGLQAPITKDQLKAACLNGRIADMVEWFSARVGDTFFVPAGTIHAIGEDLVLCEVQQVSNVTYRLHDYGRRRELHIDKAVAVANPSPYKDNRSLPLSSDYFRTERLDVKGSASVTPAENMLCIAVAGEGTIAGQPFGPGQGWELAAREAPVAIESAAASFLLISPGVRK